MVLEYKENISLVQIPAFTESILNELKSLYLSEDILFDVKLSFEEALINAVKYGNKLDSSKSVLVKVIADSQKIEIEVKDQGQGFDYRNLAQPITEANIEKLSGRGVFLIKNFMDKVEFLDNGSRIRMIKYVR